MRERLKDYQELYGDLYNLEATPAESTTYRLAKHDVERYPDIITAAKPGCTPYYTNSSHLPVGCTDDIFEALEVQDDLQTLYTSGTVFHAYLGERLPTWQSAANIVKTISDNFKLPYYTLSPTYSICQEHGYIVGEHETCPKCGKPCEVWSRITGYYRPVQNWNDGKVQEFADRKEYNIESSKLKGNRISPDVKKSITETIPSYLEKVEHAIAAKDDLTDEQKKVIRTAASYLNGYQAALFVGRTCPNCRTTEMVMKEKGICYNRLLVDEHMEEAMALNITHVPALLIADNDSITILHKVPEIIDWATKVGCDKDTLSMADADN